MAESNVHARMLRTHRSGVGAAATTGQASSAFILSWFMPFMS